MIDDANDALSEPTRLSPVVKTLALAVNKLRQQRVCLEQSYLWWLSYIGWCTTLNVYHISEDETSPQLSTRLLGHRLKR